VRTIKFRLRDRHNKIVGYEKWYLGVWSDAFQNWTAKPRWLYSQDGEKWNPYCLDFTSSQIRYKDQYTSLKDRHGKEIYEGDICKMVILENQEQYPLNTKTVIIEQQNAAWGFKPTHPELHHEDDKVWKSFWIEEDREMWSLDYFEIIGNIYENPELVEN